MSHPALISKIVKAITVVFLSLVLVLYSPIAMAQSVGKCVLDPASICTRDINICGGPSICLCPDDYEFDERIDKCVLVDSHLGDGPGVKVDSRCAISPVELGSVCTQDINSCGHPSACACPRGTEYSPVSGECILERELLGL